MDHLSCISFVCDAPYCDLSFESEEQLSSHRRKHSLSLKLPNESSSSEIQARCVEETPTPSRFLKNFSKVATDFLDEIDATEKSSEATSSSPFSLSHNPFAETFRRASFSTVPKLNIPDQATKMSINENSESLNTPSITINPTTKSPELAKASDPVVRGLNATSLLVPLIPGEKTGTITVNQLEATNDHCTIEFKEGMPKDDESQIHPQGSDKVFQAVGLSPKKPIRMIKGNLKNILPKLPDLTKIIIRSPGFKDVTIPIARASVATPIINPTSTPDGNNVTRSVRTRKKSAKVARDSPPISGSSQGSQPTSSSSQSSNNSSSQSSKGTSGSQEKKRGRTPKFLYEGITDKKERHRVRNREAALRCRERKKEWKSGLSQRIEDLRTLKDKLTKSETELKLEAAKLKRILIAHKECRK